MPEPSGRLDRPYSAFAAEEMILRDYLAADRTVLANERTLLSYMRTALAFAIGGASLIHFVEGPLADAGGVLLVAAGAVLFAYGVRRYRWFKARLGGLHAPPGDAQQRAQLLRQKDQQV